MAQVEVGQGWPRVDSRTCDKNSLGSRFLFRAIAPREASPFAASAAFGQRVLPSSQCATLKHMSEVGIRALKQNASAVVAEAAAGETVTITDRGRPVARMSAIPTSRLVSLVQEGRARPARSRLADLPPPNSGPDLSKTLQEMRAGERY